MKSTFRVAVIVTIVYVSAAPRREYSTGSRVLPLEGVEAAIQTRFQDNGWEELRMPHVSVHGNADLLLHVAMRIPDAGGNVVRYLSAQPVYSHQDVLHLEDLRDGILDSGPHIHHIAVFYCHSTPVTPGEACRDHQRRCTADTWCSQVFQSTPCKTERGSCLPTLTAP